MMTFVHLAMKGSSPMARDTDFGHDQLGHLLADHLLEVPRFQRAYSWEEANVEEFLTDLDVARTREASYFMGTVVFALPNSDTQRRQIVDGQQRIATTAILITAIRDLLQEYEKEAQAAKTAERYLRGYVLSEEQEVERLILSPKDTDVYEALLEGRREEIEGDSRLLKAYVTCYEHLKKLAPSAEEYGVLMDVVAQLEDKVQVLVAVASDLPDAYVIFETLNDRGADLTTADLLKNFLFSKAGPHVRYIEDSWVALEASFEKPDDLVRFIRYEYASRHGAVSTRKLYRAIQEELSASGVSAKKYVERLAKAKKVYLALRDPDSEYWSDVEVHVRDALLAYRRFQFESSYPVLLAAFMKWKKRQAALLLVKMAKWSVRALFAGNIGAKLSEDVFGEAAVAISSGAAKTQAAVREKLSRLIPTNAAFKVQFATYGPVPTSRAKYLLAMLEQANGQRKGQEQNLDWSTSRVNIEHVSAQAASNSSERLSALTDTIGNLALLEKKLNRDLGDRPFEEKKETYTESQFRLTNKLAEYESWDEDAIEARTTALAELACLAWPHR